MCWFSLVLTLLTKFFFPLAYFISNTFYFTVSLLVNWFKSFVQWKVQIHVKTHISEPPHRLEHDVRRTAVRRAEFCGHSQACKRWLCPPYTLESLSLAQGCLYSRACPSCVCVLAAHSCLTLCDPQTVARQALLPMEFSRQEYWSGLPFSSPGPGDWTWLSCTAGRFLTVFLGQTQFLGSCTWIVDVWVKRNFLSFFIWTILKVFTEFVTILLLFYLGFFSLGGIVNFVCYLDWAKGWSENWWNSTSCCVFEGVSRGQKHLKWQTESGRSPLPMWVDRTQMLTANSSLEHLSSPALGQYCCWFPGLWTETGIALPACLVPQPADSGLWDFLASMLLWASFHNKSIIDIRTSF